MLTIRTILAKGPIVPVCVIEKIHDAVPLANALLQGGIDTCEITLRTPNALKAIEAIRKEVPLMTVGAGSVLTVDDLAQAIDHGSQFIVAPGLVEKVALAANTTPFLPGVMTPSEILQGLALGIDTFKLFPAQVAGGVDFLQAIQGPLSKVQFCPTGGINLSNLNAYLSCANVLAVGGTWLTPLAALKEQDFAQITKLAQNALEHVHR